MDDKMMRKCLIIFANGIKIKQMKGESIMDYLPVQEFSNKWNISKRRIQILCKEGRIEGAKMIGNMWVIPTDAKRPNDARTKSPIKPNTESVSEVRRELKKVLKKLYNITERLHINEDDKKSVVLATIAYSLYEFYMGAKETDEMYKIIYKDISGKEKEISLDLSLKEIVAEFIEKFCDAPDINNILSWAYQYSNKIIDGNIYSQTQFFTEKYMIDYLVGNVVDYDRTKKIVDPCAGGGNFLVECLDYLCDCLGEKINVDEIILNTSRLYGYDIDKSIARIAIVNIRLRAISIMKRANIDATNELWEQICPNIFVTKNEDTICGSLAKDNRVVVNLVNGNELGMDDALSNADAIITNPPFATIKGMRQEEKEFLKKNYPDANCDTCVSFMVAIHNLLKPTGVCGIVSQNAWMHLKSFKEIRNYFSTQYNIQKIANLGSGAFFDLSGEKSNVSLIVFSNKYRSDNKVEILNLSSFSLKEKIDKLISNEGRLYIGQDMLDGPNGYDFSGKGTLNVMGANKQPYRNVAVPMQGTSTGNAKELVGYFWEHFGETDWVAVSNGGGYCRWQGLNDSVVKWGKEGEYIKSQKGSALRNVKYFGDTQMVFSDTGTAGLNVRVLLDNQIFIASGPGIRVVEGNEYAHLAFLNSRIAAYYVRMMSPKLTIAAGYIGQIPVNDNIYSSVVLEKEARLCIELKRKMLSTRPNNIEYESTYIQNISGNLLNDAWRMFNDDLINELLKLEVESKIDQFIFEEYGLSEEEEKHLQDSVGECAYLIDRTQEIDIDKLDKYLEKLIDAACCLKRTRASKNSLGSDGVLEYVAKDLGVNPEVVVKKIQEKPFEMKRVLNKYMDMILHNMVLYKLGYNTDNGVLISECAITELVSDLMDRFGKDFDYSKWIQESFNKVHSEIFKGVPYLQYENGVIHKYDSKVA